MFSKDLSEQFCLSLIGPRVHRGGQKWNSSAGHMATLEKNQGSETLQPPELKTASSLFPLPPGFPENSKTPVWPTEPSWSI